MYMYKCCQNCNNNPHNNPFASGVCHCTLPYYEMNSPYNELPKLSDFEDIEYTRKFFNSSRTYE